MATALVDLYGSGSEQFDQIVLTEEYRPSDGEEFMCVEQRAYFLQKLKDWKESIVEESRGEPTFPMVMTRLRYALWRRDHRPGPGYFAAGFGLLGATLYSAYLGGNMVYERGVGVKPAGGLAGGSSPALLPNTRNTTTAQSGTYLFLNLPVGRYSVSASLSGFKTVLRENIEISPGATMTVNLTMPVGEVKETVTVQGASPMVDTKAATVDVSFDSEMLAKLPTSRDAFYDLALTAPGIFEGSGAPSQTTEFQSPTAYGSATNENVFLINGVDATSPRAGSTCPPSRSSSMSSCRVTPRHFSTARAAPAVRARRAPRCSSSPIRADAGSR